MGPTTSRESKTFTKEGLWLKYYSMTQQKMFSLDFILCSLAQFTFQSVFTILLPTIPIYLSRFEAKEADIGFLVGVFSFSSLILRPIVGRALLKIPERKFMIAGALL